MLHFLDALLTLLHLLVIGFNLFGWIWRRTQRAHLALILLTAASWFILGNWYGPGYCPLTDWQWDVKTRLGEQNLPASFITYFANRWTGSEFSDGLVNTVTGIAFAAAALASLCVNVFRKAKT